jgi:hypothetical protein
MGAQHRKGMLTLIAIICFLQKAKKKFHDIDE